MNGTIVNFKIFILTNSDKIQIPNIVGYSRKDGINLAKLLGIDYSIDGNGYVSSYTVDVDENGKIVKLNMVLKDKYIEN